MYGGIPKEGDVDNELTKKLRHGYFASVSYMDAQMGRVMQALNEMDLRENTMVVLMSMAQIDSEINIEQQFFNDFPKAMIIESEGGWRKAGAHPIASVCDALNETGRNFFREQREKYGKVNFLKWSDWKRNSTKGNNEASIVTIEETIPSFAVQKYEVKWANE